MKPRWVDAVWFVNVLWFWRARLCETVIYVVFGEKVLLKQFDVDGLARHFGHALVRVAAMMAAGLFLKFVHFYRFSTSDIFIDMSLDRKGMFFFEPNQNSKIIYMIKNDPKIEKNDFW